VEIFVETGGFNFLWLIYSNNNELFQKHDNYTKYLSILERVLSRVNDKSLVQFYQIFFNAETRRRIPEFSNLLIDIMSFICVFYIANFNPGLIEYGWASQLHFLILNFYSIDQSEFELQDSHRKLMLMVIKTTACIQHWMTHKNLGLAVFKTLNYIVLFLGKWLTKVG
jgi:hypothetical protein